MEEINLKNSENFFNRELSWIEFNKRVLDEAKDKSNPLLERVKFLSIFSTNLDEFFMIRVSGLKRQIESGVEELSSDGMTAQEQLEEILTKLTPLINEQYRIFNEEIIPELKANGIIFLKYDGLNDEIKVKLKKYFDEQIYPVLTPIALDNVHPFPNLVNRTLALMITLEDPDSEIKEEKISVIQVPGNFPRFFAVDEKKGNSFVLLEDIIKSNADKLFPGMKVKSSNVFRITRNADLELEEEEASDLLTLIEEEVKKRRLGIIVRLEVDADISDNLLDFLINDLDLSDTEIYKINGIHNLGDFINLYKIDNRNLKYEGFTPRISSRFFEEDDFFKAIKKGDILLHHPFYSFSSVSEFIAQAAEDPKVYAIKLILYRTSWDSPIIKSLIEAAENGKQVTAVVELKARFDEENNIIWARALEKAGVHVVYGISGLKTHCKLALIIRKEEEGMMRYLHLGTGNYNPVTARQYTDFGLFTCDKDFCSDASDLFNYLTGVSKYKNYRKLIVAPFEIRKFLMKMIDNEIESHKKNGNGYIIIKTNSIVDEQIISKLYEASCAGLRINILCRGICTLRPHVHGISDNINVYSIVGRFLEHTRAYYFYNNGNIKLYTGSADLMTRNFDRRVEIIYPIEDENIKQDIIKILELYLKDNVKSRVLLSDGNYKYKSELIVQINNSKENMQELINVQELLVSKVKKKSQSEISKKLKKKFKKKKHKK